MSEAAAPTAGRETPGERVNREFLELLNELRVALPGVQVLLGFLLTLPFTDRFDLLSAADRRVYFVAVLSAALASMFLIAPSAHHRMRFRDRAKLGLIRLANVCALAGLFCIAVAVGASVYLVTGVLYGKPAAAWVGGVLSGATLLLWFVVPLLVPRQPSDPLDDRP